MSTYRKKLAARYRRLFTVYFKFMFDDDDKNDQSNGKLPPPSQAPTPPDTAEDFFPITPINEVIIIDPEDKTAEVYIVPEEN